MVDPITALISVVVVAAVSILSMALALGVTVPFAGVLVRYRANYTPKTGTVRLDDEADTAPRADASIGYFGMMKRVHRLEGWAGLYKGIMPTIIATLIAVVVATPIGVLGALQYRVHSGSGPVMRPGQPQFILLPGWIIGLLMSLVFSLLFVPLQIITNRAITTPHKLAAFAPRTALRVLLSPAERAQPLRLYLAPGVAFAIVLESFLASSFSFLHLVTKSFAGATVALATALPILLLSTAVLTPLEVLTARLTLQRRIGVAPAEMDALIAPLYSAEPVMEFRSTDVEEGEAPYTGLLDCARKIVKEEGWGVLTRAWWLTAAVMLLALAMPQMIPPPPPSV
ncbi:hypothetical protein K438DRAFT_1940283 [Mycena galopus ATCC 62051]|nr:hypothetical protein K438DRAFT_1940283 [Mycena galopus ATCC 62051]